MKKMKTNKGITLISLAVTIVVMMILAVTLTASMTSTIELERYNKVKEDIIILTEKVKVYYIENAELPIYEDENKTSEMNDVKTKQIEEQKSTTPLDINPNDFGDYYAIDISKFEEDIDLNCGESNKDAKYDSDDLYVINENSLTVYYLKGIKLNGKTHYTIVDDFSGGSFVSEYYSRADLSIMSAITMESNGKDTARATEGDTITLKFLSNYDYSQTPTVTINGADVTSKCIWKNRLCTVEYQVTSDFESGSKVEFSISNYSVNTPDGSTRAGEEITTVNFGKSVYFYDDGAYLVNRLYYYDTLADAVGNARDGATIELQQDVTETSTVTINKNLKIDLNGKIITRDCSSDNGALMVINAGKEVTIRGDGAIVGQSSLDTIQVYGTLIMNKVTIQTPNYTNGYSNGPINVIGGILESTNSNVTGIINNGTITIKGGIYNYISSNNNGLVSYEIDDGSINKLDLSYGGIATINGGTIKNITVANNSKDFTLTIGDANYQVSESPVIEKIECASTDLSGINARVSFYSGLIKDCFFDLTDTSTTALTYNIRDDYAVEEYSNGYKLVVK